MLSVATLGRITEGEVRNLVVCCDGSWNTPDDKDGDVPAPTNVVRLHNSLAAKDGKGVEQVRYYHRGVGTDGNLWDRIAGGGLGEGLSKNIKSAYRWLAANYRPGDAIFVFGFSRGAYTVRSLGGMIARCGLLDAPKGGDEKAEEKIWKDIDSLFDAYRADKPPVIKAEKGRRFHNVAVGAPTAGSTEIHFMGVWDTVGALGVPEDLALLWWVDDPAKYRFHDTALSQSVRHARHAVAMDEIRGSFMPTMWTNLHEHENAVQLFFPGVHGDVGGGYADRGLADGALKWMIDEASDAKIGAHLAFKPEALAQIKPDPQALLHDSVSGFFKALKTRPRAIPKFDALNPLPETFHDSALRRQLDPPITSLAYREQRPFPANGSVELDIYAQQQWNETGIYLLANKTYTFAATGQWLDGDVRCGPNGPKNGSFNLGEVAQMAASAWGRLEGLVQKLPRNQNADLWASKRVEDQPWFALMGMVANGYHKTPESEQHETFLIGERATFTPKIGGYLFCFANDAWHAYANNRGSVRLTVKQK